MFKKYLYISIIAILSFFSLEFLLRLYSFYSNLEIINDNKSKNLVRVYEEGKTFKDHQNFYTYQPKINNKRYLNYYYDYKSKKKLIKIWDYRISTNNYGLVQSNNLQSDKKSILFLGDSFTEGQGNPSWIDKFEGNINGLQVINGGLAGTGFLQFLNFENYISKKFSINKVVVIYPSDDIRRGIVKLFNSECIISYLKCTYANGVFSIPKDNNFNVEIYLKKLMRDRRLKEQFNLKKKIKFLIRDLYLYNFIRTSINTLKLKNDKIIERNFNAIKKLKQKYGDNVIFIRVNTAAEIALKNKSYETIRLENYMKANNIKPFFCSMKNNLNLFHNYDFHPNQIGYESLYKCVKKIIIDDY